MPQAPAPARRRPLCCPLSFIGVAVTNALILARITLDPDFVPLNQPLGGGGGCWVGGGG
jgi:hypothetical protein